MGESIFVSSSSDLADLRQRISDELTGWLRENGFDHIVAPYCWEADKENGRLLSDRVDVQLQLPDPASSDVPLTLCLFGERCGSPLRGEIPRHWHDRLAPWLAEPGGPGLVHPWPETRDAQTEALNQGAFPLTGTVFELLSAHYQGPDADNLVMAYAATCVVESTTSVDDIDFNDERLWQRLAARAKGPREREELRQIYDPQKIALLNLLKFLGRRIAPPPWYRSLDILEREVILRAKQKLRQRLGGVSLRNPFKATLEHWSIDDPQELPGRGTQVREICAEIEEHARTLFLLKGRSGCGKSSLMQRGVLATLRDRGALVVPFRPTDIDDDSAGRDRLDNLWDRIAEKVGFEGRAVSDPHVRHGRDKRMAQQLCKALDRKGLKLVFGIDQFEEILDELNLSRDEARCRGWWLVMKFFSHISASPRVKLVATLESSREDTLIALDLEKELKLRRNIICVDVNDYKVAEIAKQGFSRGGLVLDADVLEAIKRKWVEFERQSEKAGDMSTSSPLPLVCLWLAGLYERFEDKAQAMATGFDAAASTAFGGACPILTMADVGEDGINFENVIQKLADEAWEAAGHSRSFKEPIQEDRQYATLFNLLSPLVGLDGGGHKRLLSARDVCVDSTTARLRKEFRRRWLLRPVLTGTQSDGSGRSKRVRLVHQAVIDRWLPARQWFDTRMEYLVVEDRLRLEAKSWSMRSDASPVTDRSVIAEAAEVLHAHRGDWIIGGGDSLSPDDEILKRHAIAVFVNSDTPEAVITRSLSGYTHVHLAAAYHLVELLERFVAISPSCLQVLSKGGDNLLIHAAWSEGPAIDFLIKHAVPLTSPKHQWNAIEPSMQLGLRRNYDRLVEEFDDIDAEIGPNGWRLAHAAAAHGNLYVLRDLKVRKANLCIVDDYKRTPLHIAAERGHLDAFRYLLGPASPMLEDAGHNIPLGLAARAGHEHIIQAFLNSNHDDIAAALIHKNGIECTPLMLAAHYKHPDALRLLLKLDECDPRDDVHKTKNGRTLLHLAMERSEASNLSDDEKVRARRVAQILLEDGRLDPTAVDARGRTAFDIAHPYEDARRVIRHDKRMPRHYDKMTAKMRLDDLTNRRPNIVLGLLRTAPQALTDRHDGETGLHVLVRTKNVQVLSIVLRERLIADEPMRAELRDLTKLACEASAKPVRAALIERLGGDAAEAEFLALLLNTSVAANDWETVSVLRTKGAAYLRGDNGVGSTILHTLAIRGQHQEFERVAEAMESLPLPLDDWGRRPSEVSTQKERWRFRESEQKFFSAPHPDQPRFTPPTKFHEYARRGDVKGFERQVRGAGVVLPRDAAGKRPSEVAPDEKKAEIAALEARYFRKVN